jgi:hypothetical protein
VCGRRRSAHAPMPSPAHSIVLTDVERLRSLDAASSDKRKKRMDVEDSQLYVELRSLRGLSPIRSPSSSRISFEGTIILEFDVDGEMLKGDFQ